MRPFQGPFGRLREHITKVAGASAANRLWLEAQNEQPEAEPAAGAEEFSKPEILIEGDGEFPPIFRSDD